LPITIQYDLYRAGESLGFDCYRLFIVTDNTLTALYTDGCCLANNSLGMQQLCIYSKTI